MSLGGSGEKPQVPRVVALQNNVGPKVGQGGSPQKTAGKARPAWQRSSMPQLDGLDATSQILKEVPQTEVLVLTVHDSGQMVEGVLHAGARGYLLKSDAGRDLVAAVEALSRHKSFFSADISEMVLQGYLQFQLSESHEPAPNRLTSREREVVQLLAEEVASALGIRVKTAETHRAKHARAGHPFLAGIGSLRRAEQSSSDSSGRIPHAAPATMIR